MFSKVLTIGGLLVGIASYPCQGLAEQLDRPLSCTSDHLASNAQATLDADIVPAGSFAPAADAPEMTVAKFCRIRGRLSPVAGSSIGFQLWLPEDGWNGRLEMVGNGGYSSALPFEQMGARLNEGYAVAATDTGHLGDSPDFALRHPEAIVDWGYRAVHATAMEAKRLVTAFYRRAAHHTYFQGCSTGGHQGFMEAQRFPDDFDGIIAGAPGHNRTHLNAGFLWQFVMNHTPDGKQIIPANKLSSIANASFSACRSHNGTTSGGLPGDPFLNDPLMCDFDASVLTCKGAETDECLTTEQVSALKRMYDGARDPRTHERIYFGWPAGSESGPDGRGGWSIYWADPANSSEPARSAFWRVWAFEDPRWTWRRFDFDRDMARTDNRLAPLINAMSPNLEPFHRRGAKLIHYHGLADPVVPFEDSILYRQRVVEAQRAKSGSTIAAAERATSDFYRLFLAPGLGHCVGGAGPAPVELQRAIEDWVERGQAPTQLLARRTSGGSTNKGYSRPLCPYPLIARYDGKGSPDEATSFRCSVSDRVDRIEIPGRSYLR